MYSGISDNADIPPFYRTWQQEELGRLSNTSHIGIGSYGRGITADKWDNETPWISLASLRQYALLLLDIYNQVIHDILNGTYDSSEDIPDTYSDAWEQTISDAWDDVVEQSSEAGPADGSKDDTNGEGSDKDKDKDKDKDEPTEGGGDDNKDDENPDPKDPSDGDEGDENEKNNNFAGKAYEGARNPDADFVNSQGQSTLDEHAFKHGYTSSEEYLNDARNFLDQQPTASTQSFVSNEGTYFKYDIETNEFGIINQYGGISTYFKPETGIVYWLEQIEKYAPK